MGAGDRDMDGRVCHRSKVARRGTSGICWVDLVRVHDERGHLARCAHLESQWSSLLMAEKASALPAGGKEQAPRDGLVCDGKAGGLVIREKPAQGRDSTEK